MDKHAFMVQLSDALEVVRWREEGVVVVVVSAEAVVLKKSELDGSRQMNDHT